MASVSHSSLRVALQGDRLMAEGPVASSPFASMQAGQAKDQTNFVRFDPASADVELNSVALQPLLGSVFNNPLIAEQLNSSYRLPQELRDVLLAAPVVVRVDALEAGRFQASIQARLMIAADQIDWIKRSLDAIATALSKHVSIGATPPVVSGWSTLKPCRRSSARFRGEPPRWMVADLWNAGSGGAAACFGGRPDHRPLTDEKGGKTATSPSRETGSIGSAGLAWSGLAWVIGNASPLDLQMTALPMQKQTGRLRLQLEVP
ncbi:hypothetical protein FZX09_02355 [Synechococcus sp. MU1643]|nr:hypothetical protein [Synechococcus sp. MU1643]